MLFRSFILFFTHPRVLLAAAVLSLGCGFALPSAFADDAALNSRAYAPLPEGAAVWVEPLDGSDFNLSVQELFFRALSEAGASAGGGDAQLSLTFDTLDRFETAEPEHLDEVRVDTNNEMSLRLNMWSSTGDSLLNRNTNEAASPRFLIVVIFYDNEAQRRLWEAEASAPARARNDKRRLANLVYRVVDQLGETGRVDGFSID